MKIIVLHGDNIEKIYERLQKFIKEAKKRGWDIARISPSANLSLPEILTGESLFNSESLYIWENFSKLRRRELEWLKKKSSRVEGTLVIYNQGFIHKSTLNSLPAHKKIEEHTLPKLIWKFLDSFYPKNTKNCLKLLRQVVKHDPEEFVFALLARHLRDLYWVKADADGLPYPSWRVSKLKSQAEKFANGQLREIISELADEDIKAKTSKINIADSLDFLVVTHLE